MAKNGGLTTLQRRFVDAYKGNATEAAIAAGYAESGAAVQGNRLLRNANIFAAIEKRAERDAKPTIANRQKRQEFWTAVMEDKKRRMVDRLKASELLAKSEGDFLERHAVSIRDKIAGDDFDVSKLSDEELDELIRLGDAENAGES